MKKKGLPSVGEIVIGRVKKIYPNSVFVELVEYDATGMIHVSEVAKRWVKNIREFIKENQYVVLKVMSVDEKGISLSKKRVFKEQTTSRLNEFKREKKAEKILEMVAKKAGTTLEKIYDDVGFALQEEFGSLTKAFEVAGKNKELFLSKKIPKKWADLILDITQKSTIEKIYTIKANVNLTCYNPDGIDIIKKAFDIARKEGLETRYISAPKYTIIGKGENFKQLRSKVEKVAEDIAKAVQKQKGQCEFEIVEE